MALPVKGLEGALLRYLAAHGVEDAVEIQGIEEEKDESGGCGTCGPTYAYSVDIRYYTSFDEEVQPGFYTGREYRFRPTDTYTTSGKFGDLIQELTDEPEES